MAFKGTRCLGLAFLLALRLVSCGTGPEGLKFLEENGQRGEVVTTASGLQYEVLKPGPPEGPHPNASSSCVVHYRGTLLSGEEFDSSYKRAAPATFKPTQVVRGWTEALQLMRPGDKWKLYLPSELAYGDRGAGGKIPGGAVLVFELELLEIRPEPDGLLAKALGAAQENPLVVILGGLGVYALFTMLQGGGGASGSLSLADALEAEGNARVFMDVQIGDAEPGHVEFVLFAKHYPKTAENFRALCTGEKGKGQSGKDLTFKGSVFHRIIPGFMCQGGDFTRGNGTGGESIYGAKFDDEWASGYIGHSEAGLLSMANAGVYHACDPTGWRILLNSASHLNNKHVVFGKVTSGMETIRQMERVGSGSGSTSKKVVVVDCGEVQAGEKSKDS
ncbi:unnamed protein product [Prorocentrum cordatum]|uniref:peptidylprolyl isomerase n=1 Tax=Prorocentrum cordatum TaxID=2364126 RepID=A0ABN9X1W6_9DINO|nr:unnamed protein product [Polarella glacialis]